MGCVCDPARNRINPRRSGPAPPIRQYVLCRSFLLHLQHGLGKRFADLRHDLGGSEVVVAAVGGASNWVRPLPATCVP